MSSTSPLVDPVSVPDWLARLIRRTAEPGFGDVVRGSPRRETPAVMPLLDLPLSNFVVTPVLGHGERPGPVGPVDPAETAAVARVPLRALADPVRRLTVRGPSGYLHPGFLLPGMLVWGFTGGLLAVLLAMGGWERPWEPAAEYELDAAWRLAERTEVIR